MPITKEQMEALAAEAMEKEGRRQQQAAPDVSNPLERLRLAADIVGTAIDAHERTGLQVRAALRMFIADYAQAIGAGADPRVATNAAATRLAEQARPKTFNQNQQDPQQGDSDGNVSR